MRKKQRVIIKWWVLLWATIFTGVVGMAVVTEADAAEQVTVTLHKRKFIEAQNTRENTGMEEVDFPGEPLEGVEFSVYDVTEDYYDLLATGDGKRAVAELQKNEDQQYTKNKTAIAEETTGNAGEAQFILDEKNGILDAVYLFVENVPKGAAATGNSAHLVLVLPIYEGKRVDDDIEFSNIINRDIHLYPKNLVIERSILLKKVGTSQRDVLVTGSEFILKNAENRYFGGNYVGPTNLAEFDMDNPEQAYRFKPLNADLVIMGLNDGAYTLIEQTPAEKHQMTQASQQIQFSIADGKLEYIIVIEDDSTLGIPENPLDFSHNGNDNTIVVENRAVGGLKFAKKDANTTKNILGAEFKVAKSIESTEYLFKKKTTAIGEYPYLWKSEVPEVSKAEFEEVILTSDTGNYQLSGLKLGDYYLHETKAPTSYALPEGAKAYWKIRINGPGIVEEITNGIPNVRKGFLPATGGIGIITFVLGGLFIIGIAVFISKKAEEQNEI